ncbi:kinase-like domain-containing protein [Rhizophagus irregularis DAOM 181602=DAOM 197198]|nr:kinase-like domain-containing protein [Rhizophagus irregularis DAOM 181602=DAOM 197198]
MKKLFKPSGNKIIDNFIKYTQVNLIKVEGKMEFVPYDQFKNIEFIAEGGFSKIYKATWINGPIDLCVNRKNMFHQPNYTVVLKKLNNSKNITSKELNELKIFYNYYTKWKTQFDNNWAKRRSKKISYQETQDYSYISNYFGITQDLNTQDFMIIMPYYREGDLICYISNDFYKINWIEKLGRRPFWDRNHDTKLIIEIFDELRPPIVTNAPEGYIELLMKECWDSNPNKRPTANDIYSRIDKMYWKEGLNNPTKIIESSDIGPVTTIHLGAIYKSRPLNGMINSAMSLINLEKVKRKFEDNNDDEIELDIDIESLKNNHEYITKEYGFDI